MGPCGSTTWSNMLKFCLSIRSTLSAASPSARSSDRPGTGGADRLTEYRLSVHSKTEDFMFNSCSFQLKSTFQIYFRLCSLALIHSPVKLDLKVRFVVLQHAGVGCKPKEKSQEDINCREHCLPATLPVNWPASFQGMGADNVQSL